MTTPLSRSVVVALARFATVSQVASYFVSRTL